MHRIDYSSIRAHAPAQLSVLNGKYNKQCYSTLIIALNAMAYILFMLMFHFK